jgi:hypothetical protein
MINFLPSKNVLRVRTFQIVVRRFILNSSFNISFNFDNILMNLGLQKGSDNFLLCTYVVEFLKQKVQHRALYTQTN